MDRQHIRPTVFVLAAFLAAAISLQPRATLAEGWGDPAAYPDTSMPQQHGFGYDVPNVPGPPHSPIATTRPAPATAPQVPPSYSATAATPPAAAPVQPPPSTAGCEGAQILARVGSEVVLACEVLVTVNEILKHNKDRIPADQMETQRQLLVKELLKQRLQIKLIYQDAKRTIPEENFDKFRGKISEHYDKVVVPKQMEAGGVASRAELDAKLAELGSSVEAGRQNFIERSIAQEWIRSQTDKKVEITYNQMLRYYQEHLDDYKHPARAKWEELVVRKSSHPTPAAARAAIAALGNRVLNGEALDKVARSQSEGVTASQGGAQDWTTQGALVSTALDTALFGLPPGKLSRIIEDGEAFYIVRVTERDDASVTPFTEAQVAIKEALKAENEKEQERDYLARLVKEIPVWTIFDEPDQQAVAQRPGFPLE